MDEKTRVKLRKLANLLLFKRHIYPGAREWELEKVLGRHYIEYLNDFKKYIEPMGLTVKEVSISEGDKTCKYYLVVPIEALTTSEVKTHWWRIDEMAVLSVALSMILTTKDMRIRRSDVEEILKTKLPEWRVKRSINKLIRLGYLAEDGEDILIGLRSKLEIDLKKFSTLILSSRGEPSQEGSS